MPDDPKKSVHGYYIFEHYLQLDYGTFCRLFHLGDNGVLLKAKFYLVSHLNFHQSMRLSLKFCFQSQADVSGVDQELPYSIMGNSASRHMC